ncbi:hypothetical protein WICPIJ_006190 [Wickerhamomyces pijperi]|uniref:DnaJ homologue subfamily C member 28 conserved domain-containing protein n=1 Tax=Wickerhamomyces pijperi TaxID=599730 RepID=A0A9P8TLM7_WICPI|nr:hypothetical protein WICPIJ_006190 [Wickerhamomyces pijperi]
MNRQRSLILLRRYTSSANTKPKSGAETELENAFTERLRQLAEANTIDPNDTLLGSGFKSLIDKDPETLEDQKFKYQNQQKLSHLQIPTHANKHSRDLAMSEPWTGQESIKTTTLRMLQDKNKPLKINRHVKKIESAKNTVLEHSLNKPQPTTKAKLADEDSKFKEIYAEKFTPIGSFDKIMTIADARIEQAMREGQFRTLPRGKKLDVEIGTYVDRTEHHLNKVLIKQNITPPWIERQSDTNSAIRSFKVELIGKFENHIRHFYHNDHQEMIKEFHKRWRSFFEHQLTLTNQRVRDYNLQAPLSTQKLYMTYDREFQRMIASVDVLHVRDSYLKNLEREKLAQMEQRQQEEANIAKNLVKRLKFWESW